VDEERRIVAVSMANKLRIAGTVVEGFKESEKLTNSEKGLILKHEVYADPSRVRCPQGRKGVLLFIALDPSARIYAISYSVHLILLKLEILSTLAYPSVPGTTVTQKLARPNSLEGLQEGEQCTVHGCHTWSL
jgi:hypothetical protein